MTEIKYTDMIKAVGNAVSMDQKSSDQWKSAAPLVAGFYGSETALDDAKAQFVADAIAPFCNPKHAKALKVELPRMNSKEYKDKVAENAGYAKMWADANQGKKDARATFATMYSRVVSYAFPKAKGEGEASPPATLKTKFSKTLSDLIGKCEKAENPDFDVIATLGHLKAALAIVTK
jgi:hypothetical protein